MGGKTDVLCVILSFYTFVNFKQFLYRNQSSCLLIVTTASSGATRKGKKNSLQYTSRNIFKENYFEFLVGV